MDRTGLEFNLSFVSLENKKVHTVILISVTVPGASLLKPQSYEEDAAGL